MADEGIGSRIADFFVQPQTNSALEFLRNLALSTRVGYTPSGSRQPLISIAPGGIFGPMIERRQREQGYGALEAQGLLPVGTAQSLAQMGTFGERLLPSLVTLSQQQPIGRNLAERLLGAPSGYISTLEQTTQPSETMVAIGEGGRPTGPRTAPVTIPGTRTPSQDAELQDLLRVAQIPVAPQNLLTSLVSLGKREAGEEEQRKLAAQLRNDPTIPAELKVMIPDRATLPFMQWFQGRVERYAQEQKDRAAQASQIGAIRQGAGARQPPSQAIGGAPPLPPPSTIGVRPQAPVGRQTTAWNPPIVQAIMGALTPRQQRVFESAVSDYFNTHGTPEDEAVLSEQLTRLKVSPPSQRALLSALRATGLLEQRAAPPQPLEAPPSQPTPPAPQPPQGLTQTPPSPMALPETPTHPSTPSGPPTAEVPPGAMVPTPQGLPATGPQPLTLRADEATELAMLDTQIANLQQSLASETTIEGAKTYQADIQRLVTRQQIIKDAAGRRQKGPDAMEKAARLAKLLKGPGSPLTADEKATIGDLTDPEELRFWQMIITQRGVTQRQEERLVEIRDRMRELSDLSLGRSITRHNLTVIDRIKEKVLTTFALTDDQRTRIMDATDKTHVFAAIPPQQTVNLEIGGKPATLPAVAAAKILVAQDRLALARDVNERQLAVIELRQLAAENGLTLQDLRRQRLEQQLMGMTPNRLFIGKQLFPDVDPSQYTPDELNAIAQKEMEVDPVMQRIKERHDLVIRDQVKLKLLSSFPLTDDQQQQILAAKTPDEAFAAMPRLQTVDVTIGGKSVTLRAESAARILVAQDRLALAVNQDQRQQALQDLALLAKENNLILQDLRKSRLTQQLGGLTPPQITIGKIMFPETDPTKYTPVQRADIARAQLEQSQLVKSGPSVRVYQEKISAIDSLTDLLNHLEPLVQPGNFGISGASRRFVQNWRAQIMESVDAINQSIAANPVDEEGKPREFIPPEWFDLGLPASELVGNIISFLHARSLFGGTNRMAFAAVQYASDKLAVNPTIWTSASKAKAKIIEMRKYLTSQRALSEYGLKKLSEPVLPGYLRAPGAPAYSTAPMGTESRTPPPPLTTGTPEPLAPNQAFTLQVAQDLFPTLNLHQWNDLRVLTTPQQEQLKAETIRRATTQQGGSHGPSQ